jgi:FkbM family methyltransferase
MSALLKTWLADRLGLTRLNAAVGHLLARDVNLSSVAQDGADGNLVLRQAFLSLIALLRPTVFCDIGANDGSIALAVRAIAPACAVFGFEANPRIHARHAASMAAQNIAWKNIAVADTSGRLPVFAPRTLSRAYVNGSVVPASIVETEDTGKTSLLMRNEEATYERFDVEARTLDDLFPEGTPKGGERRFLLWIDVEGAADKVLMGASTVLRDTLAIFVETENFDFWRDQKPCGDILDLLYRKGFLPLARDREYGDKQFNMLFVRADLMPALQPALFDAASPLRACLVQPAPARDAAAAQIAPTRPFATVSGWLQSEIPVLVPCFNNPTYARAMLRQLRALAFRRIVLVDSASASPEMRTFLASVGDEATIIALKENLGPRHAVLDPGTLALLPQRFCLTDPDLVFNPALPESFLGDLALLIERHKVGKAGFALDISDPQNMRDKLFRIGGQEWTIWDWEAKFWTTPLEDLAGGDRVYDAPIDTTFALYDKAYFDPAHFTRALRVAGRFAARHLPWYRDSGMPEAEEEFYRRTEKFSYYCKDDASPPIDSPADLP